MKTGCWFEYSGAGRVGISRSVPRRVASGYRRYHDLNPGPWFKSVDWTEYQRLYGAQLARLDAATVWADLHHLVAPYEPVLMCWESVSDKSSHCHRWLVAEWLQRHLGVFVPEADPQAGLIFAPPAQFTLL